MHKIAIISIEKDNKDEYHTICERYKKMISRYSKIQNREIFSKKIAISQKKDAKTAKKSYSEVFEKYLGNYNIILHEKGELLDSLEFSQIFEKEGDINFFIGGAYGFEEDFLKKADKLISLSKMTTSHKIAKIMLYEQIYRALTITEGHPYHK